MNDYFNTMVFSHLRSDFTTQKSSSMYGNIFYCHAGGQLLASSGERPGMLLNKYYNEQNNPLQQEVIQPQMSTVPRRNPVLAMHKQ